jgi:hypothetical protein
MPGMDGTGPRGLGPMSGGGRGWLRNLDSSVLQRGDPMKRSANSAPGSLFGTLLAVGTQVVIGLLLGRGRGRGNR